MRVVRHSGPSRERASRGLPGPGKQGPGGTGGWRRGGELGAERERAKGCSQERRRIVETGTMPVRWTKRARIWTGKEGDGEDEGREDRPGTGSAWRQRHGRRRVLNSESADSDGAAVVMGIVIERVLSARRQETGGTAWTATGRQRRPDAARLDANPSPRPHVKKILACLDRGAGLVECGQ